MKFDMREPCSSCPYRKDAPLQLWDRAEFAKLLDHERNPFPGAIYGCHGTGKLPEKRVCAGWLLNQVNHGLPSIALRIRLMKDPEAALCAEHVTSKTETYESVEAMIEANYPELLDE